MNAAPTTSVGIGHNNPPSEEDDALSRDGWVAIARTMRSHWLVGFGRSVEPADEDHGSFSRSEAWLDLIMECRYAAGTVSNNGRKMRLEPGQLVGATSWLASRWNWTPKTVRGFLDKLEEEGMIVRNFPGTRPWSEDSQTASEQGTAKGTNKGRFANVLTVSKYSVYQLAHREKGPVERQVVGQVEGQLRAGSGPVEGHIYKEEQGNKGTREQAHNPPPVSREIVINCETITHANFTIDLNAVYQGAALIGLTNDEAKAHAEIIAKDWAANNYKPAKPARYVIDELQKIVNNRAIQGVRVDKARGGSKREAEMRALNAIAGPRR
jgi:hypothetical protein